VSEDPVRLVDDPSASAELRADLGRAAEAPPPAFELEGGLSRLSAAIGALPGGGGPSSPGGGASATGAAKGAGTLAGAKASGFLGSGVFWGLAACGVVGAAFVWLSPSAAPPAAVARPTGVLTATSVVDQPPEPAPASEPTSAPIAAPIVEATTAPSNEPRPGPPTASTVARHDAWAAPSAVAGASPAASGVADEIRDMAALRAAEGDPARALELATAGANRFPGGVFAMEREAIAIDALSRLGRGSEARARAEAFLAAHPKSVYVEQVRRAAHL
jgi:hypothetical protein